MNHSKIAAALHALADAFLADVEAVEQAVTGKKGGKKAADPTSAAAATPASSSASPAPASVAPAAAPAPVVAPSVTIEQVNKAVLKVAAKNRDKAVGILQTFGLTNTVGLALEKFQPVYDAFEEEIAKMDAAAVQVAQASLV
jgi:hypothetical protein